MKACWIAVVPALLLSGCVGAPTPYQRAGAQGREGYSGKRISEDTFYVTYTANARTPGRVACAYLYRRAAEVTLRYGFRYFAVIRGPRNPTGLAIYDVARQGARDKLDPVVVDEPVSGTTFLTIQCFKDVQEVPGAPLIEAKDYLEKNPRP
jgi:hypothetical protein